jgi:biopolymer transport protein ExbD
MEALDMGHDTNQQTGCSTTTIILAVLAGMFFCFLLLALAVAAVFYTRVNTAQEHAVLAREEAVMQAERARQVAEEARAQAEAERERAQVLAAKLQADENTRVALRISEEGDITLDGEPVDVDELQAMLATSEGQSVAIEADPQCPFEHVAEVLAVCREAEVEGVHVKTSHGLPTKK